MIKIAYLSPLDYNLYLFRLSWMKELIKMGYEVYAIVPRGKFFDKFQEHGIRAIEYNMSRSNLNPFAEIRTFV